MIPKVKPYRKKYILSTSDAVSSLMAFTMKIISWLFPRGNRQLVQEVTKVAESFLKIGKDRGIEGFITYVKLVRNAFYLYLSGEYLHKKVPGVKVEEDGIPTVLKRCVPLLNIHGPDPVNIPGLRALNTLLSCTRALSKGKKIDLLPIEAERLLVTGDTKDYRFDFWRALGFRPSSSPRRLRALNFRNYHFSSKSGPNGHALASSIADLGLVRLNKRLLDSICELGGSKLTFRMTGLLKEYEFLESRHPKFAQRGLRKLSVIPDKELKVRVVAILDYWSQTALLPFHQYLYRILKKIPQDCTHNQGSVKEKIIGWTEFYSIDLTAATDRFPIDFISSVLTPVLPRSIVDAWRFIMVGIPFSYQGRQVTYSVGTPMGAYTSWASFALAHHYLMYKCCRQLGLSWTDAKYCLLGDDILIGDGPLCKLYKDQILRLGVEFSPSKTYESSNFCEFAKRLFFKGEEVTPFPISAVITEDKFYNLLPVLYNEADKGWDFLKGNLAKAIESYYSNVKGFNAVYCNEIFLKSLVCEKLMLNMRGLVPAVDVIESVYRQLKTPLKRPPEEQIAKAAIQAAILDLFAASDPANNKKPGEPLGVLAERLVIAYTSDDSKSEWSWDHISSIPILNVYGQISELYTQLRVTAKKSIKDLEIWPLLLKTVGLPLSDRSFVERQQDRLSRSVSRIGFGLKGKYETIERSTLLARMFMPKVVNKSKADGFVRAVQKLPTFGNAFPELAKEKPKVTKPTDVPQVPGMIQPLLVKVVK